MRVLDSFNFCMTSAFRAVFTVSTVALVDLVLILQGGEVLEFSFSPVCHDLSFYTSHLYLITVGWLLSPLCRFKSRTSRSHTQQRHTIGSPCRHSLTLRRCSTFIATFEGWKLVEPFGPSVPGSVPYIENSETEDRHNKATSTGSV